MLRLSKMTDYGTVITAHLAREPARVFAAGELAAAVGIGMPTASKVLKILARASLLLSVRGARGGYRLARPAAEITLAEVVAALEGPLGITECSLRAGLCAQESSCTIRARWQAIDRMIRRALDETTLADMAAPMPPPQAAAAPLERRALPLSAGRP